ncbi:MAG: Trk family potassium uptake protein [Oscillospiraceae bacterium]|nr:Trk family potassium uptake protein [Oscillospiraceae bacterium]
MEKPLARRFRLDYFQIMVLSFAVLILVGAFLLMLPISSATGKVTPFTDAVFTATTSACVTGLVVQDTGTYWSTFGHVIILILVQIGGLGVVTMAASFAMVAGRKIGLLQRSTMQASISAPKLGGVVRLTRFILLFTLLIECLGAILLAPTMIRDFGVGKGLWYALFHSVSAFCNAGIDLMGVREPFSSLTAYVGNPLVNIVVMALIVFGGLGFLTWDDICTHGIHLRHYRMQSKVVLVTTALLTLIPAVGFFLLEFSDMPLGQRVCASLFQAVTPRTAGFNTVNLAEMSEAGHLTYILLMLIGGSPGSTAGGMKTTTFAVLLACAVAIFRKRDSVHFFGRRVAQDVISTAATLALMYAGLCVGGAMLICRVEGLPMLTCLYETASALGTVGCSLGITPTLSTFSRWVLIAFMYIGRVGGLTLIYAALDGKKQMGKLPLDRITVG